jgi:hypothetical protein
VIQVLSARPVSAGVSGCVASRFSAASVRLDVPMPCGGRPDLEARGHAMPSLVGGLFPWISGEAIRPIPARYRVTMDSSLKHANPLPTILELAWI